MWRTQRTCPVGLASTSVVHSTRLGWSIRASHQFSAGPVVCGWLPSTLSQESTWSTRVVSSVFPAQSFVIARAHVKQNSILLGQVNLSTSVDQPYLCIEYWSFPSMKLQWMNASSCIKWCAAAEITALNNAKGTEDRMVSNSSLICFKRKTLKRLDQKRRNNEDIAKIVSFIPMCCQAWVGLETGS